MSRSMRAKVRRNMIKRGLLAKPQNAVEKYNDEEIKRVLESACINDEAKLLHETKGYHYMSKARLKHLSDSRSNWQIIAQTLVKAAIEEPIVKDALSEAPVEQKPFGENEGDILKHDEIAEVVIPE